MIIFLFGEDTFRSYNKLKEYKDRYLMKYGAGGSLKIFDAEEESEFNLADATASSNLFASTQLIIAKNVLSRFQESRLEELVSFLKSKKNILSGKDTVIIFWEKTEIKKKNVLAKFLQKNAKLEKFDRLEGQKLSAWINRRLLEINDKVKIARLAIQKLAIYTGENTEQINNELLKLSEFKSKGEISEKDIDSLVCAKLSFSIFETIEAASSGNKKRALELMHASLRNKIDPFYLLAMYAYQFRNLLKIREYCLPGSSNKFEIAKKTGLHPYVVQKGLYQARNFSLKKLKDLYLEIKKIDLGAKTGKIDVALGLDKFIVQI